MAKKPNSSKKVVKKRTSTNARAKSKSAAKQPVKKVVTTTLPEENKSRPLSKKAQAAKKTQEKLPLSRMNYILLAVGVGMIALGFILMSLDDFVDATQFSISLHIAPIIVVAGFIEIIYAIMYQPREEIQPEAELTD